MTSGDVINFDNFDVAYNINDIAHALSHLCRFSGHVPQFYSVAQHSILVSQNCSDEYRLQGLLHDAAEAIISDIPHPVKMLIPEIKRVEDKILCSIFKSFGLPPGLSECVKEADRFVFNSEVVNLIDDTRMIWGDIDVHVSNLRQQFIQIDPWGSVEAEKQFLLEFHKLEEKNV